MQATGDNFLLTFIKDGTAYAVALNDEQREAFNVVMNLIPGEIKVVNEPIGQVMTLGGFRKMKGEI
ncbi:MAG TPA: hypothetical protein DCM59_16130 [Clostridium sp.]|nr:hypothetical protein [Clostridium sp.]